MKSLNDIVWNPTLGNENENENENEINLQPPGISINCYGGGSPCGCHLPLHYTCLRSN